MSTLEEKVAYGIDTIIEYFGMEGLQKVNLKTLDQSVIDK